MATWREERPIETIERQFSRTPDPKPPRREKASREGWEAIRAQFEFAVCVSCAMRPIELHHCVPRSQSGSDVVANLCPLCHSCHTKLEGHETGWERVAASVREYVCSDPQRYAYVVGMLGEAGFDRRLPSLLRVCERKPWCASFAGHQGECLPLSDEAFRCRDPESEWINDVRMEVEGHA